jgi:hypothetical protein
MKIVRLFTGNDQKSHFEEIELKFGGNQPMLTTDVRAATSAVFRCAPAGLVIDRHPAPRRQFLVTLSGAWEIEASNAVKRAFKTGDVTRRRYHRRRAYLARAWQRAACFHDRATGGLKNQRW